jgi:hypothetical protein
MSNKKHPTEVPEPSSRFEEVQQRFATWRQHRKKRTKIPHNLWEAAVKLSEEYYISYLSKVLRINYTAQRKQIQPRNPVESSVSDDASPSFLQLQIPSINTVPERTVEIFRNDGARMRMHLKAATISELLELGKAFLTPIFTAN